MNHIRVAKELILLLNDSVIVLDRNTNNDCRYEHLIYMAEKVRDGECHDITKANRWIGFIQGCLVSCGAVTVDDMKNINKKPEGECRHTITVNI